MISDFFNPKISKELNVTSIFIITSIIVSIPTLFFPGLFLIFGGLLPIKYPWQLLTFIFEHGWPNFPLLQSGIRNLILIPHLVGDMLVLWYCGQIIEKILGSSKFFLISITGIIVYAATFITLGIHANGFSGVSWVYGPILFFILYSQWKKTKTKNLKDIFFLFGVGALFIMWAFMPIFTYYLKTNTSNWNENLPLGLLTSNPFHVSAVILGILFTLIWKKNILKKLNQKINQKNEDQQTKADNWAIKISLAMLFFVILILALTIAGLIPYNTIPESAKY